jgi:hypothetical protein
MMSAACGSPSPSRWDLKEPIVRVSRVFAVGLCLVVAPACSGTNSPLSPATTATAAQTIGAPTPDSPADAAQLSTLRPTLVVKNGTSDKSGAKVYEFEISDKSDFSTAAAARIAAFTVLAHQTAVPEGSGGTTSYTPDFDLQPTTRLYWRARMLQNGAASDWSTTRSLNTALVGYSRPGELYDPLVNGTTIGVAVGSTTFVAGKGIQLNDGNSYVRYQLQQPLAAGEFSMEVFGLHADYPGGKGKVFSMSDSTYDVYRSPYLLVAQYRGVGGNPANCIAFKALLGDPFFKLEPDGGVRAASVVSLDPSRPYLWKGTWSNGFTLVVKDGVNGPTIYNYGLTALDVTGQSAVYNPSPHFAYLGANNGPFGEEDGSFAGAIYRNVWISSNPRPASLGSALQER